MNKKLVKDASNAHAKEVLGDQFTKNKDAVKSIETDYQAGAQFCFENIGAISGSSALQLVVNERVEQLIKHKRTLEYDKTTNTGGELLTCAIALVDENTMYPPNWNVDMCKHMDNKTPKEKAIIAAALLIAYADTLAD